MGLLDDFNAISLQSIHDFVTSGREEDLHLDFKLLGDPNLNREDRKSLATALSGFANSDGGIVVWGVDARPNASGVDCAVALSEITQVALCLTRLNTLTGQCVSPLADGVLHRAILSAGSAGFCVSLVPPSDSGPHMAKAREDRTSREVEAVSIGWSTSTLEDMFGRRQRPVLFLNVRLVPRPAADDPHEEVHFSILNCGRGVARYARIFCKFEHGARVAGVRGQLKDVSNLNRGNPVVSYQDNIGVIHPNGITASAGHATIQRAVKGLPLKLDVSVYCENMQVKSATVEVAPSPVSA